MSELLGILAKLSKAATLVEIEASLVTTTELSGLVRVLVALEQMDAAEEKLSHFVRDKQRETNGNQVNASRSRKPLSVCAGNCPSDALPNWVEFNCIGFENWSAA